MKLDKFMLAMLAAVVLALVAPGVGAKGGVLPVHIVTNIGIGLVFFLHGANLAPSALTAGLVNWRLHLLTQSATFVLFPIAGWLILTATGSFFASELKEGIFYLCAICSTISSSVAMVAIARGNVAAAVFNATLSGLIGMFATPALMALMNFGASGQLSFLNTVLDIAVQLAAPFALGQLFRSWLMPFLTKWKPWIGSLDRAVIVLIVYAAFCDATQGGVWTRFNALTLLSVAATTAVLLTVSLMITRGFSRVLRFSAEDEITAVFCGSKKSLANGAPIASILFGASPALAAILMPLMMYHQLQLIVCAALAQRYARRDQRPTAPEPSPRPQ